MFLSTEQKLRKSYLLLHSLLTESNLHRSMKQLVKEELESDRYRVLEEPLFPPANWIHWEAYRPDLLGLRCDDRSEQLVIAECETHPQMKRFSAKNFGSLWFEPSVIRNGSIRRILAIPRGRLSSVDLRIRSHWEIWVIGSKKETWMKIPALLP
jgi:hypothetical protein